MTVSSTISVFCRDGVFRTVYCHLHGEPTWNGRILHTHYATGQQAEALVEHGDIRCLGPRCDKPAGHTLQNPVDNVTTYCCQSLNRNPKGAPTIQKLTIHFFGIASTSQFGS